MAFSTLARRLPTLRLAADKVTYRDNFLLRGLVALPVSLEDDKSPGTFEVPRTLKPITRHVYSHTPHTAPCRR